jgi:gamma-glutamyltranspeptidase / glutathione hydrolase
MMVSIIQSNFRGMGSGLVADGLGFMFQDRGQLFSLAGWSPEHLRAGQAAVPDHHSRLRAKDGKPWMSFGVMGGDMQPQGRRRSF